MLNKKHNYYAAQIPPDLYRKIPKAVFAAIAVSLATSGGDYIENAEVLIREEWKALHFAGIVPQKPVK